MLDFTQKQWVRHTVMHPFEGFQDLHWKKAGSLKIAFFIILLLFFGEIAKDRLFGFQFYASYDKMFNIVPFIMKSAVIFAAWVVGNWSVCTLLNGEGTMKDVCISSAYALIPYVGQIYINVLLSHVLIRDEYIFMQALEFIGIGWSMLLIFSAVRAVHQYTISRTFIAIALTVAVMVIMLILLVLFISLIQQVYIFIYSLYTEISYRLRV